VCGAAATAQSVIKVKTDSLLLMRIFITNKRDAVRGHNGTHPRWVTEINGPFSLLSTTSELGPACD
jgi:hypothetical protein